MARSIEDQGGRKAWQSGELHIEEKQIGERPLLKGQDMILLLVTYRHNTHCRRSPKGCSRLFAWCCEMLTRFGRREMVPWTKPSST